MRGWLSFPAPFSPIRDWISPPHAFNWTLLRALVPGKVLEMPRISRVGGRVSSVGAPCAVAVMVSSGEIDSRRGERWSSLNVLLIDQYFSIGTEVQVQRQ